MAATTTTITAVGTLCTPMNITRLANGSYRVWFRVACNERRLNRASGEWTDGDTLYISVTCWRQLAENAHASFVCGDPIIVRGRIYTREFDKDGRRTSATEMEADAIGPDLTRCTAKLLRPPRPAPDAASDTSDEAANGGDHAAGDGGATVTTESAVGDGATADARWSGAGDGPGSRNGHEAVPVAGH